MKVAVSTHRRKACVAGRNFENIDLRETDAKKQIGQLELRISVTKIYFATYPSTADSNYLLLSTIAVF